MNPSSMKRIWIALLVTALSALPASRASESNVTISFLPEAPSVAIGSHFAGFSYEVRMLIPDEKGEHYFRAENKSLLTLFRTLGIKSLRIGGNTSDRDAKQL